VVGRQAYLEAVAQTGGQTGRARGAFLVAFAAVAHICVQYRLVAEF